MLISLRIENIALIDRMTVEFGEGLHVLTGETGAGKSIIVDAVALLLGARAAKELIRAGAQSAYVEGIFDVSDCPGAQFALSSRALAQEGDENTLLLSREITLSGRSVCRVNGVAQPMAAYQAVTASLLDLHGQHAHQSLMDEKNHLRFLDDFGGAEHAALLQKTRETYEAWHETDRALKEMQERARQKQDREDILKLQRKELKGARLVRGEEEDLARERDRFRNSEKIGEAIRDSYDALYDGASAALTSVRAAQSAMEKIAGLDERYAALSGRVTAAYYEIEDIGLTLRQWMDESPSDPERQEEVLSRLDLIRRLSRRYGATTGDMLDKLAAVEEELASLSSLDEKIAETGDEEKKRRAAYDAASAELAASRGSLARVFEAAVEKELSDLNMAGTRFSVQLEETSPGPNGGQTAAFLISPNRGEALQSLSKTASGGELSRLMLAIKAAAAEKSSVPSMIFDEIDTGISGRAAQTVAEKMASIARTHQVLCVTHLQQIAAMADRHYLVEKTFDGQRTVTGLKLLSMDERVDEIARMLGGDAETARIHAREMLKK